MSIFKACDIRGVYPDELDEATAEAVGRAVAAELAGASGAELAGAECVVGGDARPSTAALKDAVCRGLAAAGAQRGGPRHRADAGRLLGPPAPGRARRRHRHRLPQPARIQRHQVHAR